MTELLIAIIINVSIFFGIVTVIFIGSKYFTWLNKKFGDPFE